MSTYLQEKLEKERKDGEFAARKTPDLGDLRIPASPIRMSTPGRDRGTPAQVLEGEQTTKKGLGMGVKEMEVIALADYSQTVTTLHKQNFDLKLELYHRRERQQALESRLETVEGEKRQVEEMNDRLIEELEKRDKAVEEAVAMIVTLESQVENLLKERETIRHAESRIYEHQRWASEDYATQQMNMHMQHQQQYYQQQQQQQQQHQSQHHQHQYQQNKQTPAPNDMEMPTSLSESQILNFPHDRVLNRMPSFLSDLSETTENLRNVYLNGAKNGSLMSLPRLNEALSEVDVIEASIPDKLRSPSLSILSESSFASIYGAEKDDNEAEGDAPVPPRHQHINNSPFAPPPPPPPHGDRRHQTPRTSGVGLDLTHSTNTTPSRGQRKPPSVQNRVTSIASISELMLDQSSPLQRLERTYGQRIPSSTSESSTQSQFQGLRPSKPLAPRKVRDEKRHSLRQVLTESPNRILHDSGMPPTPDTISTATLRHYQTEGETADRNGALLATSAPQNTGVKHSESNGSIGGVPVTIGVPTTTGSESSGMLGGGSKIGSNKSSQPRPIAEFSSRREPSGSYFDARPPSMVITRPHSAGASTIAHYTVKSNYGDSDEENDDDDDTQSLASSLDIWIREGGKAPRALDRESPDLFSFPTQPGKKGWAPEAMFGAANGMSYSGASVHPTSLFSTSPTLPQPPPDRRSSLLAQTGKHHRPQSTNMLLSSKERSSRKLQDDVLRPMSQPGNWQGKGKTGSATKNSPYPPPAQPHRQRGKNNFWRRSLGNSGLMISSAVGLNVADGGVSVRSEAKKPAGQDKESETYGTAAWHKRNSLLGDDGRQAATPPPIARSRAQSITQQADAAAYDSSLSVVSALSSTSVPSMKQAGRRSPLMSSMTVQTSFPPRSNANVVGGNGAGSGVGSVPATPATPGGTKKGWLSRFGRSNSVTKKESGSSSSAGGSG
ncbi:hypothetical protein TD95_005137 [Thielaviopsis punctulata]|uniref:Centrosomin N-terminal motif 1 domain-containing protein n=1 Tax=Thielaviopsis punctulata TaxID=72032 RepID=A0A0F4ZJ68_9PEZI|nr:hypothetical protein TD95_005137 [Thielaviopsis punctulata]